MTREPEEDRIMAIQPQNIPNLRQLCSGFANIYRSASPDHASEEEVRVLKELLGIRLIIDLRSSEELQDSSHGGRKPIDISYERLKVTEEEMEDTKRKGTTGKLLSGEAQGVRCVLSFATKKYKARLLTTMSACQKVLLMFMALIDRVFHTWLSQRYLTTRVLNPRGVKQQYTDLVDTSQTVIFTILKLLSEPRNVPALIHCTAGKDRTGVTAALIQLAVGWPKKNIIEDYTASTQGIKPIYEKLHTLYCKKMGFTEDLLLSSKEYIKAVLEHVDNTYGSVNDYLTSFGFGPDDQEKLKRNILRSKI
ncbi:uncharacterized protein LOC103182731 [Callorhinchus milii]|uniref:Uncharacterized LOC103182731 n=1 Tax=Callorhinchus milii TaxID=7868 RepID=V9L682_CALMI|nr:uncharacterized protein LOC103182731 [Callorhinchus milii]|eukprot:gi/632963676/ref/XP_007898020.1/ PREDICTED: uncharacterized protein LOC103182731 [Callorhinchus milii]